MLSVAELSGNFLAALLVTRRNLAAQTSCGLLERAQAGDPQAFEALIRPHTAAIRRFTYSFTRNWSTADDLAQEALLKAFRSLATFDGQAALSTWLYTVARSVCLDHFRCRGSRAERFEEPLHEELLDEADAQDVLLGAKVEAEQLWQAIDHLDPAFRVPLVLFDIEGLAYEEIARIERVPVGTVRSRLSRARQKLASLLRNSEPSLGVGALPGTDRSQTPSTSPGDPAE